MPMMTALENVSLPLIFQGMDKKKREKISREVMAAVGLKGYEKRKPTQMSGGQQQRVGIARALVGTPKIIFADEPTGNLDTNTTKEVMGLIVRQVKRHGQTLILVTHDRSIASYADKVVTIQDGNILHVRENLHPAVFLEEQETAAGQEQADGTDPAGGQKPVKEQRPEGLKLTKEPISADERTPNETIETEGPKAVSDRDQKKDAQQREAGISKGNKEEAQ